MKKYLTFFILVLFLFNIFGYYVPYLLLRSEIHTEMRRKLEGTSEDKALTKLTFSLKGKSEKVEWKEEGKEFRYKDEMYDIVKTVMHKDSITYLCLRDEDEENLIYNFSKLIKDNLGNNSKSKNITVKELSKYHFNNSNKIYIPVKRLQFGSLENIFYQSITIKAQLPPPKIT